MSLWQQSLLSGGRYAQGFNDVVIGAAKVWKYPEYAQGVADFVGTNVGMAIYEPEYYFGLESNLNWAKNYFGDVYNWGNINGMLFLGSLGGGRPTAGRQSGSVRSLVNKTINIADDVAPSLKSVSDRLAYRGAPNSVIRGSEIARKGAGRRAFVTDSTGRIIREIRPHNAKIRIQNKTPDGRIFETFQKVDLTSDDIMILNLLDQ